MLVAHSLNDNNRRTIPCGLQQSNVTQGGNLNKNSTKDAKYYIGDCEVEEPKKIEVFGRFFPWAEHKFKIEKDHVEDQVVYFNIGSDFKPEWEQIAWFSTKEEADNFIRRQTTRIHLIVN